MLNLEIRKILESHGNDKDRDFCIKLNANGKEKNVLGIKTPILKDLAKQYINHPHVDEFLNDLPHKYYEEYQLHSFIISLIKDYQTCLNKVEQFLPYISSWSTCDQLCPKVFHKHPDELMDNILKWLKSDEVFTVRFAIKCLMSYYLDDNFKEEYLSLVKNIQSDEYYINMMRAWYFATALAKQYDSSLKIIKEKSLDKFTQNKSIQKAIESYRVSDEHKSYLRTLKY